MTFRERRRVVGEWLRRTITVTIHKAGPTGGYFNEEFASTSKLSILNAAKGEYEALILDLLGID
jgi:hypothetical protein